jgi:hypothetical protein
MKLISTIMIVFFSIYITLLILKHSIPFEMQLALSILGLASGIILNLKDFSIKIKE